MSRDVYELFHRTHVGDFAYREITGDLAREEAIERWPLIAQTARILSRARPAPESARGAVAELFELGGEGDR